MPDGNVIRNIKLTIEYEGTHYHGWQVQDNAISVQETLSKALKKLTGEEIMPEGSGRTDSGVHAYGQVASFKTQSKIPVEKFPMALNTYLPDDISIKASEIVDEDFHARFSAKGKHYQYRILNNPTRSALWAKRAWNVKVGLNLDAMNEASQYFLGYHSFKAFCAAGHSVKSFERTIFHSEWTRDGDFLIFNTKGDGFLYNMVRIMVGSMVDIGKGRFSPVIIKEAIENESRSSVGVTAPPWGLYLMEVYY